MTLKFEDLRVLRTAEAIADVVWQEVSSWDAFAREVIGSQFARAADSVGANIAEAFGRYHYGEKLQFLYYARGSLFEAKYWLNRALARQLISTERSREFAIQLSGAARQINAFANTIQRHRKDRPSPSLKEPSSSYSTSEDQTDSPLFDESDLAWLDT